ncbi:DUF3800 domain-containing protein [Pararhodobacter oceanensis]|uniref:DUF3800 domain-containing protein n=1 Tax=Pararhodobacter oceanensis TaxID=2172121 RepID=UPI003A8EDE40
MEPPLLPTLYIFLDEGGNLDFSTTGTKSFSLTSVSLFRPFKIHTDLDTYKYNLIEHRIKPRIEMEYFHCAEDNRYVRGKVFSMLANLIPSDSVDALIVDKRKTVSALQAPESFYPRMLGFLLKYAIARADVAKIGEVVVITDQIPVRKKRNAIEKAVKLMMSKALPTSTPYRVMHHSSRAHYGLQVADYFNWAIFRKWEHGDATAHARIASQIRSEFDVFRKGTRYYY